jgi:hypothetical protein
MTARTKYVLIWLLFPVTFLPLWFFVGSPLTKKYQESHQVPKHIEIPKYILPSYIYPTNTSFDTNYVGYVGVGTNAVKLEEAVIYSAPGSKLFTNGHFFRVVFDEDNVFYDSYKLFPTKQAAIDYSWKIYESIQLEESNKTNKWVEIK